MGIEAGLRVNILGVGVSATTLEDASTTIEGWIARRERHFVCITGVHGVMECQRDPSLLTIHDAAGMVTPDGMPLVWMARALGFRHVERVYGPDLMRLMTRRSAGRGYRNYYYGAGPGTADHLKEVLTRTYPDLQVCGTYCPPFRPMTEAEDRELVATINAARPDILWVGLSTPKQERWMADHLHRLEVPVMVGVGAAFDFLAGQKAQAPRWMQRNGLEWAFRMMTEPRRLAGRYLKNNPAFVWRALHQLGNPYRYPQPVAPVELSRRE